MTAVALATFADEGPFLRARTRALAEERRIVGAWRPYATEEAESAPERGILLAAIVAGITAAVALFALQVWSAVAAYPFNSGSRPLFSWPAFIPSAIEFGALAAAIGAVIMLFRRAGLTRLHHPAFDFDEVLRASQGAFVLALLCDAGEDANRALALLADAGATHSRLVAP